MYILHALNAVPSRTACLPHTALHSRRVAETDGATELVTVLPDMVRSGSVVRSRLLLCYGCVLFRDRFVGCGALRGRARGVGGGGLVLLWIGGIVSFIWLNLCWTIL